jgi:probable F420-dependent oxidoreductase
MTTIHPFRFGVLLGRLSEETWSDRVRQIESLGYSSVLVADHFAGQWEPMTTLAAAAAVTTRIGVGSLVYDVDYRHPIVYARAAATLQQISGGRCEFGLGAGWLQADYEQAGIAYDPPAVRIERLWEALQIIRSLWTQDRTTFVGQHYRIHEAARAVSAGLRSCPKVIVGGGGRKLLHVAGRAADIVGINPRLRAGRLSPAVARELTAEGLREKVGWAREGAVEAGRDPDALEFLAYAAVVALQDDTRGLRHALAALSGLSEEEAADSPLYLTGSPAEIADRLQQRRAVTGINYIVIQDQEDAVLERFAKEVMERLADR